jgi:hypothetical protein
MGVFFLVMPLAQTWLLDGGQAWLIGHEYMWYVCKITLRTCDISEISRLPILSRSRDAEGRPMTWP